MTNTIAAAPPVTLTHHLPRTTGPRSAALVAGLGYVVIFALAIAANFFALGPVLDPGDAKHTAASLAAHQGAVRFAAIAFLAIIICDVVIAWALHVLLRPIQADLSLLAAWFRLGYSVVLGVGIVFLFVALLLVSDPALGGTGSDAQILLALRAFDFTFVAGLAAFGVHLVLLGRLLLQCGRTPRALGWIIVAAGIAYVFDTVAHLALADYEARSSLFLPIVAIPSMLGELALTVWLLRIGTGRRPAPEAAFQGNSH